MVSLNATNCRETLKREIPPDCNNAHDGTMGNPQLLFPSEIELSYLAGLIDGEGSFYFNCAFMAGKERHRRLLACFSMSNTQKELTDVIYDICARLGANMRYRSDNYKGQKRKTWQVETYRMANTKKLIEAVMPYLVGKKVRAQLMLDFINHRFVHVAGCKGHRAPYDDYEIEKAQQVRDINGKRSSEAIHSALEKTR